MPSASISTMPSPPTAVGSVLRGSRWKTEVVEGIMIDRTGLGLGLGLGLG
ncbi:hypothethical protein [Ralstonia solanacearum PSI07]|nr:hypothethical protein [Ralstonia solanacearum PSI07]